MEESSLKRTLLTTKHQAQGAKMAPFGGWLMPIQYEGIIAEHNWTRSSASLFDICHMGEFIISGTPEETGLDTILTVDLDKMESGRCHYGFMLNEDGGIIDDLVVYKIADDKWMLVVNAATTDKDEAHLKKHLSTGSSFENISQETAKLDLQGPLSRDVLTAVLGDGPGSLRYFGFGLFEILGEENVISRTGYTGELGYEIYISSQKAQQLWELLLKDDRVKPVGLGARDTLRLEMGYSLYGQDITEKTTPLEAGLEHFVDFNKDFIGKEALLKQKESGLAKRFICFAADSRRAPRHDYKIYSKEQEIGIVTSGTFSPSLSCGIGMGYVEADFDKIGTEITLKGEKSEIKAKICKRPFYKQGTARSDK
ncbi:MAG: glycine cleavage system aminomethyltransferase GcvT [Candidatus Omnitrophica bacterium]|nr:glycine cleavage system aminomethyltransferase GcvT [Candidatus Omnitrophota bacterium]